jgi:hypothetical protein
MSQYAMSCKTPQPNSNLKRANWLFCNGKLGLPNTVLVVIYYFTVTSDLALCFSQPLNTFNSNKET